MATRFALLFQDGPSGFGLDELCSMLAPLDLKLEHPVEGKPFVLDDIGDQVPVEREQLRSRVAQGEDTVFEFWYSVDHDLICRTRVTQGTRVIGLALEGTDEAERRVLAQALKRAACHDEEDRWRGLVFDGEGVTSEYDWEDFFVRGVPLSADDLPAGLPDCLLVAQKLAVGLRGFSREACGGRMVRLWESAG